jgi:hypothetical protein
MPLPAGGAGWLALVLGADVLLDLAGFVVAAEFEEAGAFELAGAEAAASDFVLEGVDAEVGALVSAAALVDFDFFVVADFVPASASVDLAASLDEALADFDFFELVDFAPDAESLESALASVEEAFDDFDFLELVDFVPDAESDDAVESPEAALADLDFLELAEAVEPLAESLSDAVDFAFFDFEEVDFPEDEASLESVELASVDFFFDLLVFFAGVVLESLESEACAFTGAALASPSPSPAEIRNANTYFLSRVMLFLPSLRGCLDTCRDNISTGAFCALPRGSQLSALRAGRVRSTRASQEFRASAQIRFCGVLGYAAQVETSTIS